MDDFIKQKKSEWDALSETYRQRFEQEQTPDAVIEFLKKYPDAMRESWVVSQVIQWGNNGQHDLIKKAFLPGRGHRVDSNKNLMALKKLAILNFVNCKIDEGSTTEVAFQEASKIEWYGANCGPETIRNYYYEAKKMKPQICVKEDDKQICFFVGPMKATWKQDGKQVTAYGSWNWTIPK